MESRVIFPSMRESETGNRCMERGCPWPAQDNGLCVQHLYDHSFSGEKSISSAAWIQRGISASWIDSRKMRG